MVHKRRRYVSPWNDEGFKKWLREEKNIDDKLFLLLADKKTIREYRREYNKSKKLCINE